MPPTHTPNYINPVTRGPMVLGTNIAMICLSFTFVVLRIITRLKLTGLGLDDILICFAWLLCFGMTFSIALSTKYGLGLHSYDIRPVLFPMSGKLAYAFTAFYNPTLMMTKSSILAFYINKLGTEEKFRRVCWIMMGYVVCSSTSIFLSNIFQCSPVAGGWDRSIPGRKCIKTTYLYYFSGTNNLITDLILLILPLPIILKLRLPLRQRIGLVAVFSTGIFVTCISTVRLRMVYLAQRSNDYSWTGALSATWSSVELNTAIVCACMPAFKQFLSWAAPGIMGTLVKRSQYSNSGGSGVPKYNDSIGPRKSLHRLKSVGHSGNGANTTVAHGNDSEEYIMNDLNANSGASGISKTVEVVVQSHSLGTDTAAKKHDSRKEW